MTSVILWCLLHGNSEPFSVDIEPKISVDKLKKAIKAEAANDLSDIDAHRLKLWMLNTPVPVDDANTFHEQLQDPTELAKRAVQLKPAQKLSGLSLINALDDHITVIVEDPREQLAEKSQRGIKRNREDSPVGANRRNLRSFQQNWPSVAPSALAAKQKIQTFLNRNVPLLFCGREKDPPIPIVLLHRSFAQFIDDFNGYSPTTEDYHSVNNLRVSMRKFFTGEDERASAFRRELIQYGIPLVAGKIEGTAYETDGHAISGYCVYVILEAKDELGLGGTDPYVQSGLYHGASIKHLQGPAISRALPCIIIYFSGPYVGIAGSILSSTSQNPSTPFLVMSTLSPMIPFFWDSGDENSLTLAARMFGALKKAAEVLKEHYQNIVDESDVDPAFPYVTEYTPFPSDGSPKPIPTKFRYLAQSPNSRLLFLCEEMQSKKLLLVKFVTRYSKEAHMLCFKNECTPELYGFEQLAGGWNVAVMEYLDSAQFRPFKSPLDISLVNNEIKQTITALHDMGYVHGDIRRSNIMIREDNKAKNRIMLLDFDWAGRIGEAKYPPLVNPMVDGFSRPKGVKDRELITVEHDLEMVELLKVDPPEIV